MFIKIFFEKIFIDNFLRIKINKIYSNIFNIKKNSNFTTKKINF